MKSMAELLKEAKRRKAAESASQSIPASASSSSSSTAEQILSLAQWQKIKAFEYQSSGMALRFSNSENYEPGDGYNLEPSPYSDRDEYVSNLLTTITFTQKMIEHNRSNARFMLLMNNASTKAVERYQYNGKGTLFKCSGLGGEAKVSASIEFTKSSDINHLAKTLIELLVQNLPSQELP